MWCISNICPSCHYRYEFNGMNIKLKINNTCKLTEYNLNFKAAHCVVRRETGTKKFNNDLRIVMGKYYRRYDKKGAGEQERTIAEIFVHQEYNPVTLSGDIAIIKLAQVFYVKRQTMQWGRGIGAVREFDLISFTLICAYIASWHYGICETRLLAEAERLHRSKSTWNSKLA